MLNKNNVPENCTKNLNKSGKYVSVCKRSERLQSISGNLWMKTQENRMRIFPMKWGKGMYLTFFVYNHLTFCEQGKLTWPMIAYKPPLNSQYKQTVLKFYTGKKRNCWDSILVSGETIINLFRTDGIQLVWWHHSDAYVRKSA